MDKNRMRKFEGDSNLRSDAKKIISFYSSSREVMQTTLQPLVL